MKKLSIIIAVFLISFIFIGLLLIAAGLRVNITDSIPIGIYRITGVTNLKNSFVMFCPDERPAFKTGIERHYIDHGLCPGGYGYLMKKVVAIQGDSVSVTDKGVVVNQILIPYSKPKLNDAMNREISRWQVLNYRLKEDEVLTMTSQSEWSFDGRYYGPIYTGQIKGVITPVWVKKQEVNVL